MKGMRVRPLRTVTLGDFQIIRKVGVGATGAVYLARQRSTDCLLALKVLSNHLAEQAGYLQRFHREIQMMANLLHPGIVSFLGAGEEQDTHYFAMEFVDGYNVGIVGDRLGTRLPVGDALHIVLRCAEALHYAHEKHRIIHRDIKPTNILLSHLGQVKITDLGLAKPLEEDISMTESGVCVGTPEYMPPSR